MKPGESARDRLDTADRLQPATVATGRHTQIHMKTLLPLLVISAVAIGSSGCISTQETITQDEPRVRVEFENETAGRIFYEALSKMPGAGSRRESSVEVEVPLVFDHKSKTVRGPNTAFNEAVGRCDTNKDGKITETEARIFASQFP